MLKTYKASIINLMEVSAEFSRHHMTGDSDIKVQTNAVSDPTANKVMKRIELEKCFEDGKVSSGIINDSYDLEMISTGMKEWYLMKLEYEAICGFIGMLDKEDREIFIAYIKKEKNIDDIAEQLCIERDSATKRLYRIRKMIFDEALPWFKEYK